MRSTPLMIVLAWPITAQAAEKNGTEGAAAATTEGAAAATTVDPATLPPPASVRTDDVAPRGRDDRKDERWIHRWAPEGTMGELGAYGGVLQAGDSHELFEPDADLPQQGFKPYTTVVGELGARVGYYPSRHFGVEAEGGVAPTETSTFERATLWTARGSLVGQLGKWSLTPFVLVGGGALGVHSRRSAVGNDVDPALHFGGGLKAYISRYAQVRVDVRDTVGHQQGVTKTFVNHRVEALLGVSVTLGRSQGGRPSDPRDADGDGFLDPVDACVSEPGVAPEGCPVRDSDGDGFKDPDDLCIDEAGIQPDGCPVRDRDGDGWLDRIDQCVDVAGVAPAGCPIVDSDGDGLLDPDDECVEEPEVRNSFEDEDGCPDELPETLKQFNGVMEGIHFQSGKARILPRSLPRLNRAAAVMREFPEVRVEISGHTDAVGPEAYNIDLSQRRADAVRAYMVELGIAADRIETRGAGPNEPIGDNRTSQGRLSNRRIEFKMITAASKAQK